VTYEEFVGRDGARLRAGLVAAYGPEIGADAAAEALAYGFEHWERVGGMDDPAGYLYRVGQSEARRHFRPSGYLPVAPAPHSNRRPANRSPARARAFARAIMG
jgi:RNA polymerase sigma-70 factor (ECF subfamily)